LVLLLVCNCGYFAGCITFSYHGRKIPVPGCPVSEHQEHGNTTVVSISELRLHEKFAFGKGNTLVIS
jgi:hypothetical protein